MIWPRAADLPLRYQKTAKSPPEHLGNRTKVPLPPVNLKDARLFSTRNGCIDVRQLRRDYSDGIQIVRGPGCHEGGSSRERQVNARRVHREAAKKGDDLALGPGRIRPEHLRVIIEAVADPAAELAPVRVELGLPV